MRTSLSRGNRQSLDGDSLEHARFDSLERIIRICNCNGDSILPRE